MALMAPIMAKPLVTKARVHKHIRHVLMLRDGTPKEKQWSERNQGEDYLLP